MADDASPEQAAKLQKQCENSCKELEAAVKQHDKLAAMYKKAAPAAKKVDQLWK
jgi:hypothetical protein